MNLINEDDQARTFSILIRTGRHTRTLTQATPDGDSFNIEPKTLLEMAVHENGEIGGKTDSTANSTEPTYQIRWRIV